jgi:serine/threonine-protein kinase
MPASAALDPTRNVPVRPGDVVADKYEIEALIGSGGVGVVFSAKHKGLDQRVAIKLLQRSALGSGENVSRFEREVKILARIKSEHVARVMDTGQLPTGEPFMVLEHLEGEDLGQLIKRRGQLPIDEAVDLIVQVCEGVALAHGLGVVHRDLKPANLFVTPGPDGVPVAKVLDFGISKLLEPSATDQIVTRTQSVVGSPLYMSPEQVETPRDADERSDVWSLAVILYELITGKAPFDAATLPLLCVSICTAPPTPLSEHLADAPPGLWRVLLRALEKDPKKRHVSVAELAMALAPFGAAGSQRSAERAERIAKAHGLAVSTDDAPPDSVARRLSWSTVPPKGPPARRRSRHVWVMSGIAVLAATTLWMGTRSEAHRTAAAGFGGVLVQARWVAEVAAMPPAPHSAAEPVAAPAPEATASASAQVSADAPPASPPRAPRGVPRKGGTQKKGSPAVDILSER